MADIIQRIREEMDNIKVPTTPIIFRMLKRS